MARKQTRGWVPKRNKTTLGSLSEKTLFTWFMLAALICFFAPRNLTNKFQFAFVRLFCCPLSIGRSVSLSARTQEPITKIISRREHNRLQNRLANLTEELLQKHEKVEKLSGIRDRLYALEGAKLVLADVITTSIDGSNSKFIINRGENDGLAEGQFVMSDNSIIGTISDVSSRVAKVKLITDSTSNIAINIAGLNVSRLMRGNGDGSAKVQMLSTKREIKIGDNIYACKKPGFLDAPMKVGTVDQCKRADENPLLWDITVKPACDIKKLNDVAVIVMNP